MSALQQQQPKCSFREIHSSLSNKAYVVCFFEKYNGPCLLAQNCFNETITGAAYTSCNITTFPKYVTNIFPNIKILKISNSILKSLTRADLSNFQKITEIHINGCKNLQVLPNDIFDDLLNLEVIMLENNNLTNVGPNILNKLKYLKYVNFNRNPGISGIYDSINKTGNIMTLNELKYELIIQYQKLQILNLQQKIQDLQKGTTVHKIFISKKEEIKDQISIDVMKNIYNKKFRDFSVFIGDYEIPVHRIVLASRCPKFARMLNDENVRHFSLFNITTTVFGRILDYLYYDKMPLKKEGENWKYVEIFEAAVEYELEKLKNNLVGKIILHELTKENAIEILELSNKHDNDVLRSSAFKKIQKLFKGRELNKEFAKDTEKVKKFIETLRKKEQILKEAEEKFEKDLQEIS